MSEQAKRTLEHGIRLLTTTGPTKNYWCIHCNKFLPMDDPHNPEHHASLCPYVAIATQAAEIERLREAVRLGIGFAVTKENSPAWNEEYDRQDLDTMQAALEGENGG